MSSIRAGVAALVATSAFVLTAGTANAGVPVGPSHPVACPPGTAGHLRYPGPLACHSAVLDPAGRTVVLRLGRSDASGASAFGMLHALVDQGVEEHVVERVVSSALPMSSSRGRVRYIAEFRRDGHRVMAVWVEVDLTPSKDAPDGEPFGVVTAYCKVPARGHAENRCPEWVNDTL